MSRENDLNTIKNTFSYHQAKQGLTKIKLDF